MIELPAGAAVTRNAPFLKERRAQIPKPITATWAAMTNGDEENRLPVSPSVAIEPMTNSSGSTDVSMGTGPRRAGRPQVRSTRCRQFIPASTRLQWTGAEARRPAEPLTSKSARSGTVLEAVMCAADGSSSVAQGGSYSQDPSCHWLSQSASGSMPSRSFTACRSFCLHPRYRSVRRIEKVPDEELGAP